MSAQTVCAAAPADGSSLWIQWTLSHRSCVRIVAFAGHVDATNVDYLLDTLGATIEAGSRKLIFDLSGVVFLDVAGGRALLGAQRHAAGHGLRLDLVGAALATGDLSWPPEVIHATMSEALAAQAGS